MMFAVMAVVLIFRPYGMLGTPEDGLVTEEEAHLMLKQIDTNNGGTIDYREVAQLLSQPGWDARLVGRMSNVLL